MMASQAASYDELMMQVLNLQKENTDLRRELMNSSTHLRQIESDTSLIKDALVVNPRLTVSEADARDSAAALNDTYASRQTPPTAMSVSELGLVDHTYSSISGKSATVVYEFCQSDSDSMLYYVQDLATCF